MMWGVQIATLLCLVAGIYSDRNDIPNFSALVNCSDIASTIPMYQKCLDLYNIPITLPDSELWTNISSQAIQALVGTMDSNTTRALCQPGNKENYVSATLCTAYIMKECTKSSPVLQASVPTERRIRQQIDFQCSDTEGGGCDVCSTECLTMSMHYTYKYQRCMFHDLEPMANKGVTRDCMVSKMAEVQDCMNLTRRSIDDTESDWDIRVTCAGYVLARLCGTKYLKSCGNAALQQFQLSIPDPEICRNFTDESLGIDSNVPVDCSSKWGVRRGYLNCLVDAGITLTIPDLDTSEQYNEYILRTITLKHSQEMCSELPEHQQAVNCTLFVQRECSPDSLKPTVPDTLTVQTGLENLCKSITEFDVDCVVTATASACDGSRKRRSLSHQSILKHLCQDTADRNTCLVQSLNTCQAATKSSYSKVLTSQLPRMCLADQTTVGDNSAYNPTLSLSVMAILVLLVH